MAAPHQTAAKEADLLKLVDTYLEPLIVLDPQGKVLFANRKASTLLGGELTRGSALPFALQAGAVTLENDDEPPANLLLRLQHISWGGVDGCQLAVLKEVAQGSWSAEDTERLAFEDNLTGLPNLNIISQFMEFTLTQAKRYGRAAALLVLDLDRFKVVNDAMGFPAGDELLCQVALRLQSTVRSSDIVGRRGEDEFLILLTELSDDRSSPDAPPMKVTDRAATVASRIVDSFSDPFKVQGQEFHIGVSVGISLCPDDALESQDMLQHADSAMYLAKELGRGRYQFYTPDLQARHEKRLAMEHGLHLALKNEEFRLLYQPVVELASGRIVGVEALLRWQRGPDDLLPAAEFIRVAEESGLIVPIGDWAIREACLQARQWEQAGYDLFVTVNLSTRQLLRTDLVNNLLKSISVAGVAPARIQVDVREDITKVDPERTDAILRSLSEAGVRVAIDDFGSGFSSLRHLKRMDARILKIDRVVVNEMLLDEDGQRVAGALVSLANSLGLDSLAEGIEAAEEWKVLAELGCRYGQGYFFSPSLPAGEISDLARDDHIYKRS